MSSRWERRTYRDPGCAHGVARSRRWSSVDGVCVREKVDLGRCVDLGRECVGPLLVLCVEDRDENVDQC